MAKPFVVSGLTIDQLEDDSGAHELTWDHDLGNLSRFQVLCKPPWSDVWKSVALAPYQDFGPGPFAYQTPSGEGFEWTVLAIGADGDVSTDTDPTAGGYAAGYEGGY